MQILDLKKIAIPENRQRREFDKKQLDELRDSILRNGLLHPIVVEQEGDRYVLRAGERRLKVITQLAELAAMVRYEENLVPLGHIPATTLGELTELQRLEVEVEENIVRADFTWQERTRAIACLHELRSKQNPGQTITSTASEILGKPAEGSQVSQVSNALIVAKHLDDPDVAKAKTAADALKVISKKAEATQRARLAVNFDQKKIKHKLILGGAREAMEAMPESSFDVICSDPPYGIAADNFGSMSDAGHEYEDSKKNFEAILEWLPDETFRVAKEKAHIYLFCDVRNFERLATLMLLAGWRVFNTPLIWYKGSGMLPFPEHGPRRTYECVLYAWKGDRRVLAVRNDVILTAPAVRKPKHGAQKPVAVYVDLLGRSAVAGDRVLDCFGGTGPILVAANILKLEATYIELLEANYNIAVTRAETQEIDDGAEEAEGELNINF